MFDALGSFIRLPRSIAQSPKKTGTFATKELPNLTPYVTVIDYIKGGGQADIKKARLQHKNETRIVAVKQLRYSDDTMKQAHLEMRMWTRVNGQDNVVQLLGKILDSRGVPSMVAEYCERGDLLSYTFSVARFNHKDLLSDILKGLKHIHDLNLAHGDLKPENVVLTTHSQRLVAKICDFGSTREVSSIDRTSLEYTCTALYRSPELSTEEDMFSPTFAADMWAFGCVAFVVLCKKMPYHWVKNRWTIDILIASRKPPHSEGDIWPDISLKHLVQSCWCDTAIRPSADSLLRRLTGAKPPRSHTPSRGSLPPAYSNSPRMVAQPVQKPQSPASERRSWDPPVPGRRPQGHSRSTSRSSVSRTSSPVPVIAPPTVPCVSEGDRVHYVFQPPAIVPPPIVRADSPAMSGPQIIRIGTPPSQSGYPPFSPIQSPAQQPIQIQYPGQAYPSPPRPSRPYPIRPTSPGSDAGSIPVPIVIQVPAPSRSRRSYSRSPTRIIEVGNQGQWPPRPSTPTRSGPSSRRRRSRSRSPSVIPVGSSRYTRSPSLGSSARSGPHMLPQAGESPVSSRSYASLSSSSSLSDSLTPVLSTAPGVPSAEDPHVERDRRSRSRSRTRSPPRIIPVGSHARGHHSPPSSSPSRTIYIGDPPSRSRRSRSRSYERERASSRRERRDSHSRTPISRRREYQGPSRRRRHSRSRSRSGSRTPPVVVYPGRSDGRESDRNINININLTISPNGQVRISPQRTGNTVRVTVPSNSPVEYSRSHTSRVQPSTDSRSRNRSRHQPESRGGSHREERVESPIRVESPYRRQPYPHQTVTHSPVVQVTSQLTTDVSYSSAILRSSSLSPEHTAIPPIDLDAELEQVGFAHQESYTAIRCTTIDGRKVIEKSLRPSIVGVVANQDAIYLHYHEDMLRLKHDHLVEIRGIFRQSSLNGPTLTMEYYPTDLLTYRAKLDYRNQLRVFCEILEGLNALHSSEPPIAHQCLKASNIMIDANGSVKLSLMNSEPYIAFGRQPAPTPAYSSNWPKVSRWWSPDVFNNRVMLSRVENDIWAFGCVMLEVLTGTLPYSTFQEDESLVRHIQAGNTPDSGLRRSSTLKLRKDVVRRCWATPRPTTAHILNVLCDHLSREVLRDVTDLTGQVARAMNPFVRGHSADIYR
ncbi:Checkpoint kinase 2 [Ceratobasidium sp. 394]|nr:Checkpoint kinase 2 [Ceratobasidium sp. 394]